MYGNTPNHTSAYELMSISSESLRLNVSPLLPASALVVTVLLTVIALVGVAGNGLVIWAFKCQVAQGIVSSLLILLLACIDMSICAIGIPTTLYLEIWSMESVDWVCRAQMAFKGFIVPVSACLLTMIAVERFLMICFIPGIGFRQPYLGVSFTVIILVGMTLAVPMSLHIHLADVTHQKDSLLDADSLLINRHVRSMGVVRSSRIIQRCKKDDTIIDDQHYWYYQIIVSVVFTILFFVITLIYGIIFYCVWRHESLMFERYGKSKYRGYLIRVHLNKKVRSERYSLSTSSERKQTEQPSKQFIPLTEIRRNIAPDETKESLRCVCLCEPGVSCNHIESPSTKMGASASFADDIQLKPKVNDVSRSSNATDIEPGCIAGSSGEPIICISNHEEIHTIGTCPEIGFCFGSRGKNTEERSAMRNKKCNFYVKPALAATCMERRRRPHVYTARTFAFIAAAFIISYTPYLVVTTWPGSQQPLNNNQTFKPTLSNQICWILFYFYFINSAVNPIIYSCMNRHFKSRIYSLIDKFWKQKKDGDKSKAESLDGISVVVSKPLETTFELSSPVKMSTKMC